jgi:hypothetical protein
MRFVPLVLAYLGRQLHLEKGTFVEQEQAGAPAATAGVAS